MDTLLQMLSLEGGMLKAGKPYIGKLVNHKYSVV